MTAEQLEFVKKLIETPTPSGLESAGAMLLGARIREKTGIRPAIDVHGNLHAVLDAGAERTVLLDGHGDEIGYAVQYIDDRGFVYLAAIGGVTASLSQAERIRILGRNGVVNGVIGARPPHLSRGKAGEAKPCELRDMPCDIGASSRAEAEALVEPGDCAVVDSGFRPLAGTRVSGRGFDDRIGSFAMCEAFIRLATSPVRPKVNVHYVSSVCEEIGLVGGRLAAFAVNPDIGISCDVGFATDASPEDAKTCGDIRLGAGAALARGPIYHKGLFEHFRRTARENGVKLQLRSVPKGSGNNGWAHKMEHGGAATVQIAIPLRYMHSPVETIDLADVDAVVDLTALAVAGLDGSFPLLPPQP